MRNILLIAVCLLLAGPSVYGQGAGLDKIVSLNFQNVRLEHALHRISDDYQVFFSYSKNFIPVDEPVSVSIYNETLANALNELFASTKVVYAAIGNQIVLKIDPKKTIVPQVEEELIGSIEDIPMLPPSTSYPQMVKVNPKPAPPERKVPIRPTPLLRSPELVPLDWTEEDMYGLSDEAMVVIPYEGATGTGRDPFQRVAQLSFVPVLGTNLGQSEEITNNVSVNVLWGKNGGVNGLEVGGLVNTIEGDVHGVQIAGLANIVKGELNGRTTEKSGKKIKAGVQCSGLINVAASGRGAQFAGLFNRITQGDLQGTQAAGLGNRVNGNVEGWQLAGLSNRNRGNAGLQIAGIYNRGHDISKGQIGLINRARKVKGIQVGLINLADSVQGVPIGFLNFIRYGFNHLVVSRSETFDAAAGFKFGSPRFYNIIEVSTPRWSGDRSIFSADPYWAFGYGIGTSLREKKRLSFQLEVVAHQVNEGTVWTSNSINLLSQFRLLTNLRLAKRFSFYGGPTVNVFISGLYDIDTQTFTSEFSSNAAIEEVLPGQKPRQLQAWIGYQVGVRF